MMERVSDRGSHFPTAITNPRINSKIVAPQLRVIDDKGNNLGVLTREEALKLARPQEGIDLIEIAPTATPPVARLMSFDKYRYEVEKREKKERQTRAKTGLKQVQISARAAQNDLLIKARQAEKFLEQGHQVEVQMRLRGREKYNKEWAFEKLAGFLSMITVEYKKIDEPRFGGRGMGLHIIKKQP